MEFLIANKYVPQIYVYRLATYISQKMLSVHLFFQTYFKSMKKIFFQMILLGTFYFLLVVHISTILLLIKTQATHCFLTTFTEHLLCVPMHFIIWCSLKLSAVAGKYIWVMRLRNQGLTMSETRKQKSETALTLKCLRLYFRELYLHFKLWSFEIVCSSLANNYY